MDTGITLAYTLASPDPYNYKKASSLIEAPNIDKRPKIEDCQKLFENINKTKKRNKQIVKAYRQGYSQHMIAKVLGLNQATVQRIIKRRNM